MTRATDRLEHAARLSQRAVPGPGAAVTRADRIALTGLRVFGRHGVLPEERRDGQEFVVDAVLSTDTRQAAATDDLRETIDYAVLAQKLVDVVQGEPCNLIEALAERLALVCLTDPRVRSVEVTVHKPSAPVPLAFDDITVTVVRP